MDPALKALRKVNFDWTLRIDDVWVDTHRDVHELQSELREELSEYLDDLAETSSQTSPLGVSVTGSAGSGKTHLMGALRRQATDRGMIFVLADMTDVSDFWETVLLGFLRALIREGADGQRQIDAWLSGMISAYGTGITKAKKIPSQRPPGLINTTNQLIQAVEKAHHKDVLEHRDVLRALILFACDHSEVNDMGYKWLQGIGIDEDEKQLHGFREAQRKPSQIVRGLSWLLSLQAPTVLALDQLDAIVAEHHLAMPGEDEDEPSDQQKRSLAIIHGVAGGLLALRDVTQRTLTVVSCLERTWDILTRQATVSMGDRFEEALLLSPNGQAESLKRMVQIRLADGYARAKFTPPYPEYPFKDGFFERRRQHTPREVLKACDVHYRRCRKAGKVLEADGTTITSVSPLPPPVTNWQAELDEQFEKLKAAADVSTIVDDESEERQDSLLEAACDAFLHENPLPDSVAATVEKNFMTTGSYAPLHARARLVLTDQNERERHHAFRLLEKTNARAFQARLKAAMTASGVDHDLSFRGLTILRTRPLPSSSKSASMLSELLERGGLVVEPSDDDLRVLLAAQQMLSSQHEQLEEWLQLRRPVSKLPGFAEAAESLFEGLQTQGGDQPAGHQVSHQQPPAQPSHQPSNQQPTQQHAPASPPPSPQPNVAAEQARVPSTTSVPAAKKKASPAQTGNVDGLLRVGRKLVAGQLEAPITIKPSSLSNHTCVLAGSGSGKTVFLRRIVEEAALLGIPSIVIDGANDLSRLGDAWPTTPSSFTPDDAAKALRYAQHTDVVIWTPGAPSGNPMRLDPLPDFATLKAGASTEEGQHELNAAIDMATASLLPTCAPGTGSKVKKAEAILHETLNYFARRGGGNLEQFIAFLREAPEEVIEHYKSGDKIAGEMAELLHSALKTDPLLGGQGAPLAPSTLFDSPDPNKTRVSVLNLSGLQGLERQRRFMDQLATTLFTWIKKNPAADGQLRGLLVLDEAKDFVPSGANVAGKQNVIRLAAQARKYGLGLLFATQAPRSIDHNVVANCSTLLAGKMSSSTAIEVVQELLRNKGGTGSDIARLARGSFYFSSLENVKPTKIGTPLCLSYHPSSPPTEAEVLKKARETRGR